MSELVVRDTVNMSEKAQRLLFSRHRLVVKCALTYLQQVCNVHPECYPQANSVHLAWDVFAAFGQEDDISGDARAPGQFGDLPTAHLAHTSQVF
jgi:hypothetical protein